MPDTQLLVQKLALPQLRVDRWSLKSGDSWVILARNGAGRQWFDRIVSRELPASAMANCHWTLDANRVRLISFELQQRLYESELKLEANDALSEADMGTPVRGFLPEGMCDHELVTQFGLNHRLETRYRFLSTGESRKLLIVQALLEGVELLVLENPYDGLDISSCELLNRRLSALTDAGVSVVILLSNRQDIPRWVQHGALIDASVFKVLDNLHTEATRALLEERFAHDPQEQLIWPDTGLPAMTPLPETLVALENCHVTYGGRTVLAQLSVTVKPQQHTLITGPNGSGKSTLLGLITGDCPQCFSNNVTVLGFRRGSGESIWDIKRGMGIVSHDLHRQYRVHCDVRTVVVSGFFDSIGVYEPVSDGQWHRAEQWLQLAGLREQAGASFQSLSYGEQRLVLIARALVKSPPLLVLDEPTQGLDEPSRFKVLRFLRVIDDHKYSTLILVSHREDEHLPLFKQRLHLPAARAT